MTYRGQTLVRLALLVVVPLVAIVAAGFWWLSGGRYVGFMVGWLLFLAYAFQSPINTNLFGFFVPPNCLYDFNSA